MSHHCHRPDCKFGDQCLGVINTTVRYVGGGIARHPGERCLLGATTPEGYCAHHIHQAPRKTEGGSP